MSEPRPRPLGAVFGDYAPLITRERHEALYGWPSGTASIVWCV